MSVLEWGFDADKDVKVRVLVFNRNEKDIGPDSRLFY